MITDISGLNLTAEEIEQENDSVCHGSETDEHRERKFDIALNHLDQGWNVGVEVPVLGRKYIIDVVAQKNGVMKAIEVGTVPSDKLQNLENHFDEVVHEPYWINSRKVYDERDPGEKIPVSISLDKEIIEVTGEADEINRSSLANSLMEEWLEEHGYL